MHTTPCKEGRIWVSTIDFAAAVAVVRRPAKRQNLGEHTESFCRTWLHSVRAHAARAALYKERVHFCVLNFFIYGYLALSGFLLAVRCALSAAQMSKWER